MQTNENNIYLQQPDWIAALELLVRTEPSFAEIEIIVEGAIGGNEWCSYWITKFLPHVLYVGTDIAPGIRALHTGRVDEGIDQELYQKLTDGQEQLRTDDGDVSKVTLRANSFSIPLIESIKRLSGKDKAMFITYNGLVALMGQDYVPGERKNKNDLTPTENVISSPIYDLQLHISSSENMPSLWNAAPNVVSRWHYHTETIAKNSGITTYRIKDGLVVIPPRT